MSANEQHSDAVILAGCLAVCRSGKFESGQGTCAPLCMQFLGDPRKSGCGSALQIHRKLVGAVLEAASKAREDGL